MAIITLLTDYGAGSEHVGALHAVLAAGCPDAGRIDLAHDIPPGDIRFGALVLARLVPLAPPGVHLAVVDPGVGTARRGIAVATGDGRRLVGPDNGLLGLACRALGVTAAVELTSAGHRREPVAPTFHGRDVFAPASAHLAGGGALADLGPAIPAGGIVPAEVPAPGVAGGRIETVVAGIDRFGNLQTFAAPSDLDAAGLAGGEELAVTTGEVTVRARLGRVFADVPRGELLVHVDAHGHVAVAVNGGSATRLLGAAPGSWIAFIRQG
jgi:S-adenosylmethionine hydrolase